MNRPRRIGLLTGGGDCPGLNGVIRAVTLTALREYGTEVIGIEDGFEGLVEGRMRLLDLDLETHPSEVKRQIGVVPEGLALFERLTGGGPPRWHQQVEIVAEVNFGLSQGRL